MRVDWEGMGMQSIQRFVSCQIQLLVTHARFTMSQQCHVTTTTIESAAHSLLSPPVCPLSTNAHVFDVRTWHRSHQEAKFSPPHVCVTPKHDVRLSLFFCRPHPMFRNTSALLRGAAIKANITQHSALRPADGHITNIAPHPVKP